MEPTAQQLMDQQSVIAWIFIVIAFLAAAFSLFFLFVIRYRFFKGMAWAFLITGVLQLFFAVCVLRGQLVPLPEQVIPIQQSGNFTWFSGAGICAGAMLWLVFRRSAQTFWKGAGLGLLIQSSLSAFLFYLHHQTLNMLL